MGVARSLLSKVAGISAPDLAVPNAALRSYSTERRLRLLACMIPRVAYFGQYRVLTGMFNPLVAWFDFGSGLI
jgi:hypothetical protein